MINLQVNGQELRLDVDPSTPLLWILRDHLGLMGTKYSCGIGECGSCTVHIDGQAQQSCQISVGSIADCSVVTIEGLEGPIAGALNRAWQEVDVPQCGYCQPGQIMTAAALLAETPRPDDQAIDQAMSGVLCRCGTYQEIRQAVKMAGGDHDQ